MSRKTSQILSVGLLLSSMVVMGLEIGSKTQSSEASVETIAELENKIDELEEENNRIKDEHDRLTEGYANSLTLSDVEVFEEDDLESTEAVTTSSDEEAKKARQFTVTVKEGEPSSVVAEQLEYLGVIEDRYAFSDYLETNGLAKKIRPGNYVVTSNMTTDELAQAILK
ncbi:endolytic transglycosylase MltG [Alkalibacterium putridalgicola]|uniref:YceG-like family protein n=1 Tax=Alkalibacterium putridalgicola TaxID=426703 RepID=A0A1H7TB19_9LACT|nr:endolytic transglycosylase MltG [Alkalibacterium putridalgicola]GEK89287.1 hypothetical protein APU01nite_13260 [Alkalibacterium putridalgicola]SEL81923.1 YceG-like family protein [Alkalibacterium putridalgicola]